MSTTEDIQLSDHFTLYDLTKTKHADLQEINRNVTTEQIAKLREVARLLEHVVYVLGTKIIPTSGYRCPELNKRVGSTDRSQHLLCEAADFIPGQQDIGTAFRNLWKDVKENKSNVGQLIFETQERSYGIDSWLHISLGTPYRFPEKCAQILRMTNGVYTRLA